MATSAPRLPHMDVHGVEGDQMVTPRAGATSSTMGRSTSAHRQYPASG